MSQSLSELASPDAMVRDRARAQLMLLRRADLPVLHRLLERSEPLAPSQAAALRQIVREVYLVDEEYEKNTARGFLGILMGAAGVRDLQQPNDDNQMPGVIVEDRFPGFCASRMLRDGDIILGTAEPAQVFNNVGELQNAIRLLDPGSIVRLQVLRYGQIIDVPVKLESFPIEADDIVSAEGFMDRREKKFDEYWHNTFARLLRETWG